MKRLISISTAAALIFSLMSPLVASACMKSSGLASCHRSSAMPKHHCAMHGHEEMEGQDEMSVPASGSAFTGVPGKCPMRCCMLAQSGKQIAVAFHVTFSPQFAVQGELHFVPVVFTTIGHSSHTDRGPPSV
jgi:hypothetical protein